MPGACSPCCLTRCCSALCPTGSFLSLLTKTPPEGHQIPHYLYYLSALSLHEAEATVRAAAPNGYALKPSS